MVKINPSQTGRINSIQQKAAETVTKTVNETVKTGSPKAKLPLVAAAVALAALGVTACTGNKTNNQSPDAVKPYPTVVRYNYPDALGVRPETVKSANEGEFMTLREHQELLKSNLDKMDANQQKAVLEIIKKL